MTTALDLITRSLRLLGVYGTGEVPGPDESQDGLTALNALLGSLSNTPMVYAKTLDTIALTAGVASITVGPSGTTVTDRPIKVLDESYLTSGSVSYPLSVVTQQRYSDIVSKSTQSIPQEMLPIMNMPDVTLTFWPVPTAGLTLNLWSIKALATFPTLTTTVSLPPGYEDLLPLELAEASGPEYDRELPPVAQRRLQRLRANLALTNFEMPMLKTPSGLGHFNILTNGSV